MEQKNAIYKFESNDAIKYGTDEAIFLYNLKFWIRTNIEKGINKHDDKTWTYNSIDSYVSIFLFWKRSRIYRIINSLVKQGAIVKGNYNKFGADRTTWYALADESTLFIPAAEKTGRNNQIPKPEYAIPKAEHPKFRNRNISYSKSGTPIPNIKTNNKTKYKTVIPFEKNIPEETRKEISNRRYAQINHPLFPDIEPGQFKEPGVHFTEIEKTILKEAGLWD